MIVKKQKDSDLINPVVPSATQPQNERHHLAYVDSFRAIAALYVMVHHIWTLSKDNKFDLAGSPTFTSISHLFSFGHFAVGLFIVLSGYSLVLSVLKRHEAPKIGSFLKRRALRILPPYYAALAIPLVLHGIALLKGHSLLSGNSGSATSILFHLFLIQDVSHDTATSINSPMWSVSVEWRIYLLFPLFSWVALRYGLRSLLVAAVATSAIALLACHVFGLTQAFSMTGISPHYLILFAFGMFAAVLRYSQESKYGLIQERLGKLPWHWLAYVITALCSAFLACVGIDAVNNTPALFVYDIIAGMLSCLLLLSGSYASRLALINHPAIARVGLMAYSIYLTHFLVLQGFVRVMQHVRSGGMRLVLFYIVGTAIVILAASFFYRFVERPCIPVKK